MYPACLVDELVRQRQIQRQTQTQTQTQARNRFRVSCCVFRVSGRKQRPICEATHRHRNPCARPSQPQSASARPAGQKERDCSPCKGANPHVSMGEARPLLLCGRGRGCWRGYVDHARKVKFCGMHCMRMCILKSTHTQTHTLSHTLSLSHTHLLTRTTKEHWPQAPARIVRRCVQSSQTRKK